MDMRLGLSITPHRLFVVVSYENIPDHSVIRDANPHDMIREIIYDPGVKEKRLKIDGKRLRTL